MERQGKTLGELVGNGDASLLSKEKESFFITNVSFRETTNFGKSAILKISDDGLPEKVRSVYTTSFVVVKQLENLLLLIKERVAKFPIQTKLLKKTGEFGKYFILE